mgnify:CR=1 FL=1
MYNRQLIEDNFIGLAGLRQTDNPDFPKLNDDLIYTGENILIQHPLINIENIDMTSRNYALFMYPGYDALTQYESGNRIRENDFVYESLIDGNIGNDPSSSPNAWKELNLLSLYLEDVFKDAITDTVQKVFELKKLHGQTKTLLQNQRLSDTVGSFNNRITNVGSLVGLEFTLKKNQNIKAVIDRIGLQLTTSQTGVQFYLYHSSQLPPIATFTIDQTKNGSHEWHQVNLVINYLTDEYDAGGTFYLMYDQDSLVGQAIKKVSNWNKPPCGYCNRNEVNYFNKYTKYLYLRAVEVRASDRNQDDPTHLWDLTKNRYIPDNNFGLNFEWTVKCDLTQYLIKQKEVFQYAVRDVTIMKLLHNIANSTRQNGLDEKVRLMARSELQSTGIGGLGFMHKVENKIKEVDFEISALDGTCMPCNNKNGIRIGAAGLSRNG